MKKTKSSKYSRARLFLIASLVFSCQQATEIAVPEDTDGFETPEAVSFTLPEGKPFTWKEIPKDSVPVGKTYKFSFENLPSTPFNLQKEKPIDSPIQEFDFELKDLRKFPLEIALEMDSLSPVIRRIPEPRFSDLTTPQKYSESNAGLLSITESEGLIGNVVTTQAIDFEGYHWIATDKALMRFVGDGFEVYEIVPDSFSGTREILVEIAFFPDGRALACTLNNGFYILDWEKGIIEDYKLPYGFARYDIDSDGAIWAGSIENGMKIIDLEKKTISSLTLPSDILTQVFGAKEDSKGNVWIGGNSGLGLITPEREEIIYFSNYMGLPDGGFYDFLEDGKGNIWLSSFTPGLKAISLEEQKVKFLGPEQGFSDGAVNVSMDQQGKIWIGSNGAFTIFDPEKETLKTIETNLNQTGFGPPSYSLIDESGLYWYGTSSNGALVYDPTGMESRHFDTDDGLSSNEVWGMVQDKKERIWMASYEGVNIYDPESETLKLLKIPARLGSNDNRGITKLSEDEFFIGSVGGFRIVNLNSETITAYSSNSETASLFWRATMTEDGLIWISSNNGIIVFDRGKNEMKKLDAFSGLAGNTIWTTVGPDHSGLIWLASDSGINAIDPKKETVSFIGMPEGLTSEDQSVVFETSDNRLIIGGSKGISILNKDRTTITNVNAKHGLIPESLYDAVEVNNRIHIGSSNGIIVIDEPNPNDPTSNWKFTNYNRDEGFPFTDYNQLTAVAAKDGTVWWGAAPVITVNLEDPDTNTEIPNEALITGVKIMDQFPTFYDPASKAESALSEDSLPSPKTENYLVENNIQWSSITERTNMPIGLKLPHHQNSLTFNFSNPSFRSRDDIEFRYILQGSDSQWSSNIKENSSKTYFNLLPGEYKFKVITKSIGGKWSEPGEFTFTILSPWWATWWAFFIYVFALALIIYIIVQVRSSYLKRENRLLEERVNHRTSQLKKSIEELKSTQEQLIQSEKMASLGELTAGIAHEIQNPLNFVNNFSEVSNELIQEIKEEKGKEKVDESLVNEILGDLQENLSKINHHGKRADSIVKGMLQHSRNSSNEKELTDINVLADEYLRLSYHGLRAKDKSFTADFELDLEENLPKIEIVPQDIGRVLLNLINNGFYAAVDKKKNSTSDDSFVPKVTVSTKKISEGVEIKVRDNGTGIPEDIRTKIFQPFFTTKPTGSGTGLGLSMSYDIITQSHNGKLEVESKSGEYTEFIIILPD